jgi:hypothetical protein
MVGAAANASTGQAASMRRHENEVTALLPGHLKDAFPRVSSKMCLYMVCFS